MHMIQNSLKNSTAVSLFCLFISIQVSAATVGNEFKSFQVEGNRLISTDTILLNLKAKPGDSLNGKAIQEEINRIGEMGYFSYVGAEIRPTQGGKCLIFKVEENPIIGEINMKGNTVIPTEKCSDIMESKIGCVFNTKLLSQDIQNIGEFLARQGFPFSRVSDANVKEKGSIISIEITDAKIGDIKIEGLKKTKEKVVRRELTIKPGDIYDRNKIIRDLQRIDNLGLFAEVKPDHLPGKKPDEIVLVIQVVEQKTGRYGGGCSYSALNGAVGFANYSINNFKGENKRLYAKTEFGGIKTYELGYFDPWLNDRPVSFGCGIYNTKYTRNLYDSEETFQYDEQRRGGNITMGRRINRDIDVSLSFRDENITVTPTDSTKKLPSGIINGRMQTLGGIIDKDTRNNRFRPSSGVHDTFSVETTGGILSGANNFSKYHLALRRYFPISRNRKTTLALQGVTGYTSLNSGCVPVYELYGVGGTGTIRGYEAREFLGTKTGYGNVEVRQVIAKNFDLVGFFDIGSAFGTDINGIDQSFKAKKGYGFGIRIITPLGPVAIDYGKATDRKDGQTYFDFGAPF